VTGVLLTAIQDVGTSDNDAAQETQATSWRQNTSDICGRIMTAAAAGDDDDNDDDVA